MTTLFTNIKQLVQVRESHIEVLSGAGMSDLPTLDNAFVVVKDGVIAQFGSMDQIPELVFDEVLDCQQSVVLPTWCDSHTHLVFGDDRHDEFLDRIKGLSYGEIAAKGGGILNSAKKLQKLSEDVLFDRAIKRLELAIAQGTGAIEIKSGYGLTPSSELKILRVIRRLKQAFDIPIRATFLGAHAIPASYKTNPDGYVDEIIDKMIPTIARENLANYIDVFCEKGYFTAAQMNRILEAGKMVGLRPKVHVNQFNSVGGIKTAIENNALTVDHLEVLNGQEIELLQNSPTMAVALPICSLFLNIPYTAARKLIAANIATAIASDYNPGSAPSSNMHLAVSLACIQMKMTPEEAINAATINGAYAMGVSKELGSICVGKRANFVRYKQIDSYKQLPYYVGQNLIDTVYINGREQ